MGASSRAARPLKRRRVTNYSGYVRQSTSQRPTGQWLTASEGHRWWFDSGAVSLDFAYSGAIAHDSGFDDTPERGVIQTEGDLAEWLKGRFSEFGGAVTDRELVDALALCGALARAFLAHSKDGSPEPHDIDVINLFAATPDIPPVLGGGTRQAGRSNARVGQTLSELAREAVELLSAENNERIRECSANDCHIVYYDESRSNNRRWCSMQRCGNRAKVRAHRAKEHRA